MIMHRIPRLMSPRGRHFLRLRSFSTSHPPPEHKFINSETGVMDFSTLHELQTRSAEVFASNPLFGSFSAKLQDFEWITYSEFNDQVRTAQKVLKEQLGVSEYDTIGIISNNRVEWAAIACAAYSLNCTIVPMYEAQMAKDWTYILNDSECKALFVATEDIYNRVQSEVVSSVDSLNKEYVLCLDAPVGSEEGYATAFHRAAASSSSSSNNDDVTLAPPLPEDLANLVYTSGTTGVPKGVELTHSNTVSQIHGVRGIVENPKDFIREADRSLAFLPWAHSYGQTCELWCQMAHGASMGICRGVPSILEDLSLVKPTVLFSVPTLYKRIYDGVHNMMETTNPIRRTLMKKAIQLGKENIATDGNLGFIKSKQFNFLDKLVLSKIRDRFGGNLRHGFVAGAACPREILDFMDALSIPVLEGYGLTETSPIICINTTDTRRVGAAGFPIKGVTPAIVNDSGEILSPGEEGEICCYGPNVMRGYHGKEKETNEVISLAPDGKSRMFHTGDLGRMDSDGFIYVTGRIKEQYKLENGKYVCPSPIEEGISMSRFIMQAVLVGANRPHNVALLVPDWVAIRNHLKIDEKVSEDELVNDKRVRDLIDHEVKGTCEKAKIKKFEVPVTWRMVAPFTVANNMLTPKMSIRRHMVVKVYQDVIAEMYGDEIGNSEGGTSSHPDSLKERVA